MTVTITLSEEELKQLIAEHLAYTQNAGNGPVTIEQVSLRDARDLLHRLPIVAVVELGDR